MVKVTDWWIKFTYGRGHLAGTYKFIIGYDVAAAKQNVQRRLFQLLNLSGSLITILACHNETLNLDYSYM